MKKKTKISDPFPVIPYTYHHALPRKKGYLTKLDVIVHDIERFQMEYELERNEKTMIENSGTDLALMNLQDSINAYLKYIGFYPS